MGVVAYPWNIALNSYPTRLKYKVWIELKRLSPQAWCIEHLVAVVSSFDIMLDHTPMSKVQSLERMMVVVVVHDLSHIPMGLVMWIRIMSRDIEVVVYSWLEEPLPISVPTDPTP